MSETEMASPTERPLPHARNGLLLDDPDVVVEVTKGYAGHERDIFERIADAQPGGAGEPAPRFRRVGLAQRAVGEGNAQIVHRQAIALVGGGLVPARAAAGARAARWHSARARTGPRGPGPARPA